VTPDEAIRDALALIASVPGYESVARDLARLRITYVPTLKDRGQASLHGHIRIGPETLEGGGDTALVSLAGTLVHEHSHTCQNPFLKTLSFWTGIATRTHPMRRYERPAYEHQAAFLAALSRVRPDLAPAALWERTASQLSYQTCYDPNSRL
jgi:hypothetical protein